MKATRLTLLTAVLLTSACKLAIQPDIYLSDVEAVRTQGKPLPTKALVMFEVPGEDKCAEASSLLVAPLSKAFASAEYKGCRKVDFNTFADFVVTTEIVQEKKNETADSKYPIYVGVFNEDDGSASLGVYQNVASMKALVKEINDASKYGNTSVDYNISGRIVNDTSGVATLVMENVYSNGNPVPYLQSLELERRGEVSISASDVFNDAFALGAWVTLARVK